MDNQTNRSGDTLTLSKDVAYKSVIVVLSVLLIISILTQGFGLVKTQPIIITLPANTSGGTTPTVTPTPTPTTPNPTFAGQLPIAVPSYVPARGNSTSGVKIVEFGDYQCPYCKDYYTGKETQIIQNYVNTGKATTYFLDWVFLGSDSQTTAKGAWCANEQGLYYQYHDYVYTNQGQENSGWATPDKLKTLVANIQGLNTSAFSSCLDSGRYQSRYQDLTNLGRNYNVQGTPAVFIVIPKTKISAATMQSVMASEQQQYGTQAPTVYENPDSYVVFIGGDFPYAAFDTVLSKINY